MGHLLSLIKWLLNPTESTNIILKQCNQERWTYFGYRKWKNWKCWLLTDFVEWAAQFFSSLTFLKPSVSFAWIVLRRTSIRIFFQRVLYSTVLTVRALWNDDSSWNKISTAGYCRIETHTATRCLAKCLYARCRTKVSRWKVLARKKRCQTCNDRCGLKHVISWFAISLLLVFNFGVNGRFSLCFLSISFMLETPVPRDIHMLACHFFWKLLTVRVGQSLGRCGKDRWYASQWEQRGANWVPMGWNGASLLNCRPVLVTVLVTWFDSFLWCCASQGFEAEGCLRSSQAATRRVQFTNWGECGDHELLTRLNKRVAATFQATQRKQLNAIREDMRNSDSNA